MKKYFVSRGDFGNIYSLAYTETPNQEKAAESLGFSRITRKEAESLCREERQRRKYDEAFAYYADSYIYPIAVYEKDFEPSMMMYKGYLATFC